MQVVEDVRDSGPGGMGHACELETSIYLAIDPEAVFMDKAVDENSFPEGKHSHMDWSDGPLAVMPWWNAISHTGVHGDATKATADKGRTLLAAAVHECVEFVQELKEKPLRSAGNHPSGRRRPGTRQRSSTIPAWAAHAIQTRRRRALSSARGWPPSRGETRRRERPGEPTRS